MRYYSITFVARCTLDGMTNRENENQSFSIHLSGERADEPNTGTQDVHSDLARMGHLAVNYFFERANTSTKPRTNAVSPIDKLVAGRRCGCIHTYRRRTDSDM